MAEISPEAEQKINQLQILEQSLQNILLQKQQFQTQLVEIDSAVEEIEKTSKAYKIVGNIMVSADKENLKKELNEKKEISSIRIKALERQETNLREKAKKLQNEVMENMKDKEDGQ